MNCYEAIDVMGDAIEGSIAADAKAGLEDHLEECPPCRNYLEQLRLTCRALENLPLGAETNRRRSELVAAFRREHRKNG